MAILHFPLGVISGKLEWEDEDKPLTKIERENASAILYYMGYDVYENYNEKEIDFGLRLFKHKDDMSIFRDILLDFSFLFHRLNINLPDIQYAESTLEEYFIPLDERNKVTETRAIVYNEVVYLTFTQNYMVSGKGYSYIASGWYTDQYNKGVELLPIIANDIITDVVLLIKADVDNGYPYNDPFAPFNNRDSDKEEEKVKKVKNEQKDVNDEVDLLF